MVINTNYAITSNLFVPYRTVALIGYADDGPSNKPIYVDNTSKTDGLFGEDSQLTKSVHECYNSGAQSVFVIKINGTNSYVDVQGVLKIECIYSGSKHNDVKVTIHDNVLTIDKNNVYEIGNNILDLVKTINSDAFGGVHLYKATILSQDEELTDFEGILENGSDEYDLSETEIHSRLENIYFILSNISANIITPLCASYDSNTIDFGQQLIDFCKERFSNGEDVVGVLPTSLPLFYNTILSDAERNQAIQDYSDRLISKVKDYGIDGRFLSVVASYAMFVHDIPYVANCAASYAGYISWAPYTSSTNKPLEGIFRLYFDYTKEQATLLSDTYIVLANEVRRGIRIKNGATLYPNFNISTSKILNHINAVMQDGFSNFNDISNDFAMAKLNLEAKATRILNLLIDSKEIKSFNVRVSEIDTQTRNIRMNIDFVRYSEIKIISTQVNINYGV